MTSSRNEHGAPAFLIGPESQIETMPIRTFRTDNLSSNFENEIQVLLAVSNQYFKGDAEYAKNQLIEFSEHDLTEPRAATAFIGNRVIPILRKKMISPKIVTGAISELAVTRVHYNDLPANAVKKLRPSYAQIAPTENEADIENFYSIDSKLRLGSKVVSMTCGLLVLPLAGKHPSQSTFLDFKAYVSKMSRGEQDEYDAWRSTIAESRAREAIAIRNPYSGGSVNPR